MLIFSCVYQIREQLLELIKDTGKVLHEPYVTMKDGHLRSKKKNKKSPLSVADDLAAMEDLEEVRKEINTARVVVA